MFFTSNDGQEPADYPDFAHAVSAHVANQDSDFGILVCNSGVGMSIAANRHKNIRAALCHNQDYVKLARQHNDANILCIGTKFTDAANAEAIVKAFLQSNFDKAARHLKRVNCHY